MRPLLSMTRGAPLLRGRTSGRTPGSILLFVAVAVSIADPVVQSSHQRNDAMDLRKRGALDAGNACPTRPRARNARIISGRRSSGNGCLAPSYLAEIISSVR